MKARGARAARPARAARASRPAGGAAAGLAEALERHMARRGGPQRAWIRAQGVACCTAGTAGACLALGVALCLARNAGETGELEKLGMSGMLTDRATRREGLSSSWGWWYNRRGRRGALRAAPAHRAVHVWRASLREHKRVEVDGRLVQRGGGTSQGRASQGRAGRRAAGQTLAVQGQLAQEACGGRGR